MRGCCCGVYTCAALVNGIHHFFLFLGGCFFVEPDNTCKGGYFWLTGYNEVDLALRKIRNLISGQDVRVLTGVLKLSMLK